MRLKKLVSLCGTSFCLGCIGTFTTFRCNALFAFFFLVLLYLFGSVHISFSSAYRSAFVSFLVMVILSLYCFVRCTHTIIYIWQAGFMQFDQKFIKTIGFQATDGKSLTDLSTLVPIHPCSVYDTRWSLQLAVSGKYMNLGVRRMI